LTPEAVASEFDLTVKYQRLERLVYARVIATGAVVAADPFTVRPAITKSELFTSLVHHTHVEKGLHLATYEQRQGQVFKIQDIEEQRNLQMAAAAGVYNFKLDNLRLDSQFLIFFVRDSTMNTDWTRDRMQSDPTATILPGGGSVASLQQITSFRLLANGNPLIDVCTDLENRAVWRHKYFPGSQIAEAIYFVPFSLLLRDIRNVASFQNMANLGNVELEITMPVRANASIVDVYSVCHNIIQMKKGDVVKALR
jgi:hypothetical protein